VNQVFVNWGPYESSHVYYLQMTETGSTVSFRVFDGDPTTNTIDPGWYGDNSGALTVEIYELA